MVPPKARRSLVTNVPDDFDDVPSAHRQGFSTTPLHPAWWAPTTDRLSSVCREMTDNRFWHVYFSIVKAHLPDVAFSWGQETLPVFDTTPEGQLAAQQAIANFSTHLKDLGSRIQQAAAANQHRIALPSIPAIPALEALRGLGAQGKGEAPDAQAAEKVSRSVSTKDGAAEPSTEGDAKAEKPVAAAESKAAPEKTSEKTAEEEEPVLEADPDLEAYLQVRCSRLVRLGGEGARGGQPHRPSHIRHTMDIPRSCALDPLSPRARGVCDAGSLVDPLRLREGL